MTTHTYVGNDAKEFLEENIKLTTVDTFGDSEGRGFKRGEQREHQL